ncbi:MAG: aldehyde dehydrogenase family protein [Gammaproteobacteria bacterium]|nr:aldehyde dehydrogenase family protein [Gammaproteobacteria bacterium]
MGPIASRAQSGACSRSSSAASVKGARLLVGGPGRPEGLNKGFYVKPTVFTDVNNAMTTAREAFGPVLALIPLRHRGKAVAIANDNPYGLSSYIGPAISNTPSG